MQLESSDSEHRSMMQDTQPSLIETMKADTAGMIALLPYHVRRLKHSAQTLGYPYPGDEAVIAAIKAALDQASTASTHVSDTRVRLLLSPSGQLDIQTAALTALQSVPWIGLTPLELDSAEPLLQHKTTHRPWYDAATQWLAKHHDYFDLIFLNEKGELCEGSRSNIYVLQNGTWLTPPLASGLLGGVLRTQLLEMKQAKEATLTPSDLNAGKGSIRLSNALRGWFDVELNPSLFPGRLFP